MWHRCREMNEWEKRQEERRCKNTCDGFPDVWYVMREGGVLNALEYTLCGQQGEPEVYEIPHVDGRTVALIVTEAETTSVQRRFLAAYYWCGPERWQDHTTLSPHGNEEDDGVCDRCRTEQAATGEPPLICGPCPGPHPNPEE